MEEGKEMAVCCSSHVTEEKPGVSKSNVSDFPLLTDEKFDFDLSLSPSSGSEEEVFVGPLGHKEKCISVNVEAKECAKKISETSSDSNLMWSPLTGEKFVEIFKEAHLLALQIETESKNEKNKISQVEERGNKTVEKFVQDSKSKLKMLRNLNIKKSPRAVKRETYCVQESPACQLPPFFQKQSDKLLSDDKAHALHTPPSRSPVKMHLSPAEVASSLLTQEQQTKEKNTRTIGKLPMAKPLPALGKSDLLIIGKPKPGQLTSISTNRDLNSIGSPEDPISDKSSAASDVFESPFDGGSSVQDKALPAPNKIQAGLKKTTHLKLPGVASGITRKNTSSSSSVSSTTSSLNSSLPISPVGKNGKSNVTSKTSVSGSKFPSNINRLSLVRPTRLSSLQTANSEKAREPARSASTPRISSAVRMAKSSAATASEAAGSGIQRLSSVPSLQKLCQQNEDGSATKGSLCPKPKARVLSISASQTKVPGKTGGTPTSKLTPASKLAPKATPSLGLTFCGTLGSAAAASTPVKASAGGASRSGVPAAGGWSGLPTPIRRTAGLPAATPKTAPRMAAPPRPAALPQSSSLSAERTLTASSKQTRESKTEVSSEDDVSPPPVLPLALNFSPEKTATEVVENELKENEVQNKLTEEEQTEALLVDTGVDKSLLHTLECESTPLIDLSNTPEVSKSAPLKPTFSGQVKLIDLSSPLITLSPDINKENLDSPLLKF